MCPGLVNKRGGRGGDETREAMPIPSQFSGEMKFPNCTCVCVCLRGSERERARARASERKRERASKTESERERERKREGESLEFRYLLRA